MSSFWPHEVAGNRKRVLIPSGWHERVADLERRLLEAMDRIAQLEAENARLQQQLAAARKNSSTSSKPPSSDIVKPKKPLPRAARNGNAAGSRDMSSTCGRRFHPRRSTTSCPTRSTAAPIAAARWSLLGVRRKRSSRWKSPPARPASPSTKGLAYWCPHCRKFHYAPLPEAVRKAGLFGPRLTALVAFMKGVCHASFSTIRKFLRDVVRVQVSRGYLAKLIGKVSESLAKAYAELFERLPGEAVLNIDETGHKENGEKFWTWCFRAQLYTLFRIDKSRGSKVLVEVLGEEFNGVLGCDYFSAYRKYMREFDVLVQFCMAHLIRDVKFLLTLPGRDDQAYGQRVRDALRDLFAVIHRREKMTAAGFQKALEAAREQVLKAATTRVPDTKHARNLAKRFRENGEAYFRFITTPGIDPTNNLAEQAIRFVVIDRHITQGTRSEKGRRWCERIWTVIATCAQQGRAVFQFLLDSVQAYLSGTSPPSLLPSGP